MFNRKNRMAALMSMAKTSTLSQEDNADAPQPATEPAQKDAVEAPLTNDKGLETGKSTDGSGTTMAPGQDGDETQRTDVGSGAKELAPEAEIRNPKAPQADFDVKAPVLDPAADPNNPMGDDTKPQVAEPAANVGAADKSETQTENTEGGEKVGEDANKPKNAEGTTSGKPAMEGEKEGKNLSQEEITEKDLKDLLAKTKLKNKPVTTKDVEECEVRLGIKFTAEYTKYLTNYGSVQVGSEEFYGLGISDTSHLNLLVAVPELRKDYPKLPFSLVPVLATGDGDMYVYDNDGGNMFALSHSTGKLTKISANLMKFIVSAAIGKLSEESDAAEIAAAAIAAYEQGVERGQAAADGVPSEAPAEQQTPEQAAEQAAATVAQAAADAAQASAADIAAGGTGEVGVGEPAGVDGAAEGTNDDVGIPADVGAAEGGDTTPAAEAALDDAAAGGVEPDSDPADGSNGGVPGDDATTAGEGEGSTEGEPGAEEGEPTQTSETEGGSNSDIETEEAKKKADAEEEALDDLDDLEEDEEIAMESYSIAGDMLQGILNFAQESYQSEVGGVTPGEARALAIALSAAQRIAGVQATQGLSLEAIDYRMPADVSDDLVYSTEELLEQVSENLQLSQESFLDIFRSRGTIMTNFCKESETKLQTVMARLRGKTGTTTVDVGTGNFATWYNAASGKLDKLVAGVKEADGAIRELNTLAHRLRESDDSVDRLVSKFAAVRIPVPSDLETGVDTASGKTLLSVKDDKVIDFIYENTSNGGESNLDASDAGKVADTIRAQIKLLRSITVASETAANRAKNIDNSTGLSTPAAVTGIASVLLGGVLIWGVWALFLSRSATVRGYKDRLAINMKQAKNMSSLMKLIQDALRDNIKAGIAALNKLA